MQIDTSTPITLIGVPTNLGASNLGVEMGPNAHRYNSLVPTLQHAGLTVTDIGNVACEDRWKVSVGNNPRMRYVNEIIRISTDTARAVSNAINKDNKVIVLGGDHTTCLGAVSGASVAVDGDIGLIYFDAHGDMNTDQNTPTGNVHGMQLASLMGFGAHELARIQNDTVKVHPSNVLHIGGSDWDPAELELLKSAKIPHYTMNDMLAKAFGPLLPMIKELQSRVKYIWISLDLDSIDSQYAPAAGMPNQRGMLYREVKMLAEYIGANCNVLGIDVVEYNPLEDIDKKTTSLTTELIANFFGKDYNWYTEFLNRNQLNRAE